MSIQKDRLKKYKIVRLFEKGERLKAYNLAKRLSKVKWLKIVRYNDLSYDFIREFQDYVDWSFIAMFQTLSEDFIREFKDKINWYQVMLHQRFSGEFLLEMKSTINESNYSGAIYFLPVFLEDIMIAKYAGKPCHFN